MEVTEVSKEALAIQLLGDGEKPRCQWDLWFK